MEAEHASFAQICFEDYYPPSPPVIESLETDRELTKMRIEKPGMLLRPLVESPVSYKTKNKRLKRHASSSSSAISKTLKRAMMKIGDSASTGKSNLRLLLLALALRFVAMKKSMYLKLKKDVVPKDDSVASFVAESEARGSFKDANAINEFYDKIIQGKFDDDLDDDDEVDSDDDSGYSMGSDEQERVM